MHYRNVTLSTRVSAAQKAEYVRLAAKYNVSVSEWALTLIEHHKNDYGTIGDPTPKEVKLERALQLKNKEIQKLLAYTDVVIDGRFIQSEMLPNDIRGSENQKIIFLTNDLKEADFSRKRGELVLESRGGSSKIMQTGFM